MENVELRKVLIYLYHKYKGDREKINDELYNDDINMGAVNDFYRRASYKLEFLTILDDDYPQRLKELDYAPYVIGVKKGKMAHKDFKAHC